MNDQQRLELLRSAVDNLERTTIGFVEYDETGKGSEWRVAMRKLERLERDLMPDPVPALGPVFRGSTSILKAVLTHNTDGIALYPAFDGGWRVGVPVIAPEPLTVISPYTSSSPGAAFYARGASRIRYWFGHLHASPRIGVKYARGQEVGRIVAQETPHLHLGVNVELLLGAGVQLKYGRNGNGPDYTYGSPTIGEQLARALV